MRPGILQYLLSYVMDLCGVAGAVAGLFLYWNLLGNEGAWEGDWRARILAGLGLVPVGTAGFIVGIIFPWAFLARPVFRLQGWPFQIGEEVWILRGGNRTKKARIRGIWDPRFEVLLDLGEEAAKSHKDVLFGSHVCRAKDGH